MTHMETPLAPILDVMTVEEKWDRLYDFFTMDHAISYKTHKCMDTVQAWVDDTVEAYGKMMGRFIDPLATPDGQSCCPVDLQHGAQAGDLNRALLGSNGSRSRRVRGL